MAKTIVTGGAGFIGSNLVDALVERGDEVVVIDNLSGGTKENINTEADFHQIDICDLEAIRPLFKDADLCFHLAAKPRVQFSIENPQETHNVNVTGTLNILEASREAGLSRVVFSSSSSIYGDQDIMPIVETMEANPKSPYGLHKYIGERYARVWSEVYSLQTVSLRYFNVYGPRQSAEGAYALVIAKFLEQVKQGQKMTITGDGEQTRDFTHIRDVVKANLFSAESDKVGSGEAINIGAGNNVSINKIAELIGGEIEYIPPRFEPKNTLADNQRARDLLGWEPQVSIEDGIKELKEMEGLSS